MSGGTTRIERERFMRVLEDLQGRVMMNHLDRETLLALEKAVLDFGKRYLPPTNIHPIGERKMAA